MRPKIPDILVDDIDKVVQNSSYQSKGEFIRDAIRHHVDETELKAHDNVVDDEYGISVGIDQRTGNNIMIDRFNRAVGYNSIFSGMVGSGKTVSIQSEIIRENPTKNLDIVVIDIFGSYSSVCHSLGGKVNEITDKTYINPLGVVSPLDKYYNEDIHSVDEHIDMFVDFIRRYLSFHGSTVLDDVSSQSVIRMATRQAYMSANEDLSRPILSPTLNNVIRELANIALEPQHYVEHSEDETEIGSHASKLLSEMYEIRDSNYYYNDDDNSFAPDELKINDSGITTFNLENINNSDECSLLMQSLIYTVYKYAKSTPNNVWLVVDEAHKLIGENMNWLEQMIRHSRHYDFGMTLAFQELSQVKDKNPIFFRTMTSNIPLVKIHKQYDTDVLRPFLSQSEIQTLRTSMGGDYENGSDGFYCVDGESYHVKLQLSDDEKELIGINN